MTAIRRLVAAAAVAAVAAVAACSGTAQPDRDRAVAGWVYQLAGYPDGRLDAVARSPYPLAVVDLARDGGAGFFAADEIGAVRRSGKTVLAYFSVGTIETYRPEYDRVRRDGPDLLLNRWADWPDEHFVRYWDQRWWEWVVRPRIDQAIRAGFDGAYLDTPLAYEELDLALARGETRDGLAAAMVDLIVRASEYAKARRAGFLIVPQNAPELRHQPGYTAAVDGIGMEELFVLATDEPCRRDFCAENLAGARALRDAGKLVLAVDYARAPEHVAAACDGYRAEHFSGYVTIRDLDEISKPCVP